MSSTPIKILLAEDDDGHATLIQRNLQRVGLSSEISRVRDGQEAIDYVTGRAESNAGGAGEPLIMLLDINMPRLDGVEVLKKVKADPSTAKIPVIMLTTTDDPNEIDRCYRFGCSAYLTKPVAYDRFVEAIKRLGNFLGIVRVPSDRAS